MPKDSCALFLPSLPVGGAERMMLNIAKGLSDMGYSVDLVLVKAEGDFLDEVPDSINIVDLDASRVLTSLPSLVTYLRREKPNVLLSTITPTNVVATWATLISVVDTKHVIRVARPESEAAKVQKNTFKQRVTAGLARLFYPLADEIVAISKGVAQDLRENTRIKEQKIHVIYNPTVSDKLLKEAEEQVDHPWFNDENIPVVLGVGRLVDQKDFETLIRSFAILRGDREARLVIFGDGEKREMLEKLIIKLGVSDDVELPGFTDNPYKYMANSDVFVNSAIHEGFGNVIIEAMSCECPVVATDCPGAPSELLSNGEYGFLVPVNNPEIMAQSIKEMILNPTRKEVLRHRANDFRLETIIGKYEKVLFK